MCVSKLAKQRYGDTLVCNFFFCINIRKKCSISLKMKKSPKIINEVQKKSLKN